MTRKEKENKEIEALEITITPITWIIAPVVTKEQLKRWYAMKWIDEEGLHLDRAFPRDCEGRAVIPRFWLEAPMVRAVRTFLNNNPALLKIARNWTIIDEKGFPVDYVVIPDKPLRYRRVIITQEGKRTTEFFEYIDGTYPLALRVLSPDPKKFLSIIMYAGRIGMMSRTKHGYGKFNVVLGIKKPPKIEENNSKH